MKNSGNICLLMLLLLSPVKGDQSDEERPTSDDGWCWTDYALAAGVGTAAVAAAPVVLSAAGFTSAGVTAGSIAAGAQSLYGGSVASGTVFAAAQSAGAAGLGATAKAGIFSAASAATYYIKSKISPCGEGPKCKKEQKQQD